MTNDLRLDGSTPRTHTGDPATSHRAEARNRSGRGPSQEAAVLRLITLHPGWTASRLAMVSPGFNVSGLSNDFHECRQQVRRRLTDLKNKGVAIRIGFPGEGEVRWFLASPAR